jgi:hypothetical protein
MHYAPNADFEIFISGTYHERMATMDDYRDTYMPMALLRIFAMRWPAICGSAGHTLPVGVWVRAFALDGFGLLACWATRVTICKDDSG